MLLIYRTCPQETFGDPNRWFRPSWFDKKACLENALFHFSNSEIEFVFVCDGGKDTEWYDYLTRCDNKEIISLNHNDNQKSLIELYKIIDHKLANHDSFYLLEDDYLHKKGSYKVLKESLKPSGLSCLYHHPDRFTRNDDVFTETPLFLGEEEYYRFMESTTGTFAGTQDFFRKFYLKMLEYNIYDRDFFRYCISQGTKLCCPVNTYSTHVHIHFMSKFVNWEKLSNEF